MIVPFLKVQERVPFQIWNAFFLLVLLSSQSLLSAQDQAWQCVESDDQIQFKSDKRVALVYNKSMVPIPDGLDLPKLYERSGYLHPIKTPAGKVVSGDFAKDHPHQHGLFMAWVNTEFLGHDVDFWNQKKQTGNVRHHRVQRISNDGTPVFQVQLVHEDISGEAPVVILEETWQISLVAVDRQSYVFDFVSDQTCVADSPLTLREYHYGGFGIRGTGKWFRAGAANAYSAWQKEQTQPGRKQSEVNSLDLEIMGHRMLTDRGKSRFNGGNHSEANWTAMYGPIDGEDAGIAILSHPENFRAPQPVRMHPSKPYFSLTPVFKGPFDWQPGKSMETRYRIVVFDGPPDVEFLNTLWDEFANQKK